MIQKIIKVGNSAALTIPREFLQEANLKIGDEMVVETNSHAKMLLAKTRKYADKMNLTPEFYSWLNEISVKYETVIKELAHK